MAFRFPDGNPRARRRLRFGGLAAAGCLALALGCMDSGSPTLGDRQNELSTALATVPAQFQEITIASNLASPTSMALAPDGRIFFCEQMGKLRVVKNDALLPTAFFSIAVNSEGERGLIGVALDPAFATNRYVYVYHTTAFSPLHNRVSRFTASAANPDVAEAGSETAIFDLDNLGAASNHNGGAIHFGADGKLYIAVGENATPANAQDMGTVLGKLLRINSDGSIPTDNPFYSTATGKNRAIWALGLRNPFTFSFQPGTGKLFINDVGEYKAEEINEGAAGSNYGWPTTEGPTADARFVTPLYSYRGGSDCAIVGSAFYNPKTATFPAEYSGAYFFGDHCGGWIKRMNPADKTITGFATGIASLTDIKVADDGSIYYSTWGNSGTLRKIVYTATQAAYVSQHPADQTAEIGKTATFTVTAGGTGPIAYQWQRDKADITGATSASYTTPVLAQPDSGAKFRCAVSNGFGGAVSNEAVLNVSANQAPVAAIAAPKTDTAYQAGQTVAYSGTGSDAEDGALPDSAFTWLIVFHHDTHTHPFLGPLKGAKSGAFAIPTSGETSANTWFRIHLTVVDKGGLSHEAVRDVNPVKTAVQLATLPAGLQLLLDGQPAAAPIAFTGVAGMDRSIEAPSPQTLSGKTYEFVSWSDAGAARHTLKTPATAATFTATYRELVPPSPPSITGQPANVSTAVGASTSFTVTASGTAPLTYQWQRNGADLSGSTAATLTLATVQASDSGARFRCIVANAAGRDTSDEAVVTLLADRPPAAAILMPAPGTAYSAGMTFNYSGTGTDPEDGDLPASAFTWDVLFYHADHTHPFLTGIGNAKSGSFTIPATGETSSDVYYMIVLTVRDKEGLKHVAYSDLRPVKTAVTLSTAPAGLQIRLDGTSAAGPLSFTGVAGMQRTLEVVSPQTFNGSTWEFVSWSDGGARLHTLATPPAAAAAATVTATFREMIPTGLYRPPDR